MPGVKGRRIRAALVDLAVALGWAAVVAAAAVAVQLWVGLGAVPPLQLNVLLGGLVVLPVIGWLALTEGGRYGASPGKQWLGLRVQRAGGGPLGRGRALVRNLVKVGVPWLIGHAAVLAVVTGSSPLAADVWILVSIAVLLPVVYLASCLLEDGRTPYDHAAGSRVVVSAAGRRFAED
jgi:uncharacterized RDD family membrane protein YckC